MQARLRVVHRGTDTKGVAHPDGQGASARSVTEPWAVTGDAPRARSHTAATRLHSGALQHMENQTAFTKMQYVLDGNTYIHSNLKAHRQLVLATTTCLQSTPLTDTTESGHPCLPGLCTALYPLRAAADSSSVTCPTDQPAQHTTAAVSTSAPRAVTVLNVAPCHRKPFTSLCPPILLTTTAPL